MQTPVFDYRTRPPRAELAAHVERLWYARGRVTYERERILPTGQVVLIVNLGDGFETSSEADPSGAVHGHAWVCGQRADALINRPLGETHMVGVTFRPAGAYPFLNVPLAELTGGVVPLDCLWGPDALQARERIGAARTPTAKLVLLERLLLRRLAERVYGLGRIRWATARLEGAGNTAVGQLTDRLGISHRYLIEQFKRFVGLTPNALARVRKFHAATEAIRAGQVLDWADLAQRTAYYDQSHFNRDFKRYSGVTPTRYIDQRAEAYGLDHDEPAAFVPLL